MSDVRQLYQEIILEHHRAPRHARPVAGPTHSALGNNPLCGDRVTVTLRVGVGDTAEALGARLIEVGCEVQGCALCRASGSIASELLLGSSVEQAAALVEWFVALVRTPAESAGGQEAASVEFSAADSETARRPNVRDASRVAPLLEVRHFASRRRCATLPWETFGSALRRASIGTPDPEPAPRASK